MFSPRSPISLKSLLQHFVKILFQFVIRDSFQKNYFHEIMSSIRGSFSKKITFKKFRVQFVLFQIKLVERKS